MRCGCYMLLLGLGLTFGGGQGLFEWAKNRNQTVTTYANFEKQNPTGGWFKISDAHLDIPSAMWMTSSKFSDDKDKIYVPLSPEGEDKPGTKIHVLVELDKEKDAATVKLVDELGELDKSNQSEEKILQYALKNRAKLFPTRPVEGMIKFGINDIKSSERQKIAALNSDLAPDFVVLEENAHPNGGTSILMFIGGLALTLFSLAGFLGGKDKKGAPPTATPGASAPPPTSGPPANPMTGGNAG